MVDRIVKIEDHGNHVVAIDEAGKRFVSPAGRWDWQPLEPPPVEPEPRSLAGRRLRRP